MIHVVASEAPDAVAFVLGVCQSGAHPRHTLCDDLARGKCQRQGTHHRPSAGGRHALPVPFMVVKQSFLRPVMYRPENAREHPGVHRVTVLQPGVGCHVTEHRENGAGEVRLDLSGGNVLLEEDPGEAHVVDHLVDSQRRPCPPHELQELIHLVEHNGLLLEVEDGLEQRHVEDHVERVPVGPVAGLARGPGAGSGAPGEGEHGVAEGAHGVRGLAGVDGARVGGLHDLPEPEHRGVEAVQREGRVVDEARLQELELPALPLVVLAAVGEVGQLQLPEELER